MRPLPGGGPQGGTLGIEEYLSQNNDNVQFCNAEFVTPKEMNPHLLTHIISL